MGQGQFDTAQANHGFLDAAGVAAALLYIRILTVFSLRSEAFGNPGQEVIDLDTLQERCRTNCHVCMS